MALNQKKYERQHEEILRDIRPFGQRVADGLADPTYSTTIFIGIGACLHMFEWALAFADLIMIFTGLYFWWLTKRDRSIAFKLPMGAKFHDANNVGPGRSGEAEGILYLGNTEKSKQEVWFTNSDIRTHILYLGTTGAGKTEGLKSMVANTMAWSSGFVYVDGKADTDLWSSLSSMLRRFGRDDDLLILNYMTGNSDSSAPSHTMNPFSSGSASYLVNMLVSLMPESGGDNAMWKERAVSLVGSMMPVLTWKRDFQEMPLSISTVRDYLSLNKVIALQRDQTVPEDLRVGIAGYLDTLPGFVHDAYDDNGEAKPPGPDTPQYDTTTSNQQHGYLAMQFTRSLQSLGDDYGYIFDTQAADVDMMDIVLNRRILVVLIPALEKSGDEIANLGKIVAATMKGMMGATLGSTVEGSSETVIENKPTNSATPFITVFDEVGYYTAEGMAVMAAQARSLGFCLIFAGQDLPAMKKRVKEEANSITANCNLKIFGKLEDPTETKDFFEKTVGSAMVIEASGFQMAGGNEFGSYFDTQQAGIQLRPRASYDELRSFKEGQAIVTFGETVEQCRIFYSNPGHAKAMRVTRFMALPVPDENLLKHASAITKLRDLMVDKAWTAQSADVAVKTPDEIEAMARAVKDAKDLNADVVDSGIMSVVEVHALSTPVEIPDKPTTQTNAEPKKAEGPKIFDDLPEPGARPNQNNTTQPQQSAASPASGTTKTDAQNQSSSGGDPMGFFTGQTDQKPTKPETNEQTGSQPAATAPTTPTPPPAAPQKPKLPKEIQDIIEAAGKNTRNALFQGNGQNDENA